MPSTKTAALCLALLSTSALARPVADSSSEEQSQLTKRDNVPDSFFDANQCFYESDFFYNSWMVTMQQWGGLSTADMLGGLEKALKKNKACQSYSWFEGGIAGAQKTSIAASFNADDFCTGKQIAKVIAAAAGVPEPKCASWKNEEKAEPDLSDMDTAAHPDGTEDPADGPEKRSAAGTTSSSSSASVPPVVPLIASSAPAPEPSSGVAASATTDSSKTQAAQTTGTSKPTDTSATTNVSKTSDASKTTATSATDVSKMASSYPTATTGLSSLTKVTTIPSGLASHLASGTINPSASGTQSRVIPTETKAMTVNGTIDVPSVHDMAVILEIIEPEKATREDIISMLSGPNAVDLTTSE